MKFGQVQFSSSAWIAAGTIVIGAIVAGCSGSGHSSLPVAPGSSAQNLAGGQSGTLAVKIQLPTTGALTNSSKRSPQYVSGGTQGVYITGTCLVGGGTVTQSCTGAAFPAVYADVSASSPLCSAGPPRTCMLSANPVPGYSYAITVVALDSKPTGEVNGYGTGFASTANELSAGSAPGPMPAATGSPAPSPTPTALGAYISKGNANSVSIFLNAIATQFVQVNPNTGAAILPVGSLADNTIPVTAGGVYTGIPLYFSAGDAAGNLIAAPACFNTYNTLISAIFPTITASPIPGSCDGFVGPDGKAYALTVTSSLPTHVCTATPPATCAAGTSAIAYSTGDFAPITQLLGTWTQAPPGVLTTNSGFQWGGIADNDTCSGATPKCGVPIALTLSNNIPMTATPLVGRTSSYTATATGYLAPFVTTVSCGTNASCASTTTPTGCTGFCPQIALNNNGTATVTVYLYGSGGTSNLASSTGCYATTPASCFSVAVNGSPPANNSQCYTGLNQYTGLASGSANCSDVLDTGTVAGAQPTGTVDCQEPPGAPATGTTVALIKPGTFTKGALAPPGVADAMTFAVQAVGSPTAGYCSFQIVDPNRNPQVYSLAVLVQVSSSGTVITLPPSNPLPGSPGAITEYPLPTSSSDPVSIAAGPDGALWFAENKTNRIGRVTTSGSLSESPLPTPSSFPFAITSGSDGALWFTEFNTIGRISTSGSFTEFADPTPGGSLAGIVSGADGALWFAESNANGIGRITTSGSYTDYIVPTLSSSPYLIAAGSDGALWFTEAGSNKIGRITTSGSFTEYIVPTGGSGPYGIGSGPDGAIWFTEAYANKIGRITSSGAFSEFPIPTPNSVPFRIVSGPDGALWFTEANGNKIGRITTGGSITEFVVPTPNSNPWDIAPGADGALWFTEANGNKIARIVP